MIYIAVKCDMEAPVFYVNDHVKYYLTYIYQNFITKQTNNEY